ncbi:carboxymuconolactone decarboxylase family protein [Nocardia higoensis]|uniref:Carboxymuconolactone decarboxylase family protein n=1 Tax=Nocardia higoensis TaxID=228599 RepID=A0ABS0DGW2_9NOCA|nr:carboxymuconolactone decarboxylase family protein [Nocardia higoensis]MBF6357711.1 carboxymuconolactone decarboxylase family protein [Nocardia higoensis]
MSRVDLLTTEDVTDERGDVLDQIHGAFGFVPNMFKAVANSPAALQSMWGSFGALGAGTLGAKIGEQIAVAVADRNRCDYCLSAHTLLGKKAGATAEEMTEAQKGYSADPRTAAILTLATELVDQRGQIDADAVRSARDAGLTSEDIVETIAHVALNVFTNYINLALDVPVDFDRVRLTAK